MDRGHEKATKVKGKTKHGLGAGQGVCRRNDRCRRGWICRKKRSRNSLHASLLRGPTGGLRLMLDLGWTDVELSHPTLTN